MVTSKKVNFILSDAMSFPLFNLQVFVGAIPTFERLTIRILRSMVLVSIPYCK